MPRRVSKGQTAIRIGYVGLVDAAPLIVADRFGLFEKRGLHVVLSREVGWATIREKVVFGELEAAHALSTLPFVATLGLDAPAIPCVAGMVISRGGNAIALSEELRHRGVENRETLKKDVKNRKAFRRYRFATVYACSPHSFHLRDWLGSAGIDTDADVELVTLPPAQMCRNLAAGTIDGFCAGEPWASRAISEKIGWSPANSEDLSPGHPEKVLMVKEEYADRHPEEHIGLIAAIVEACAICEDPLQRERIAALLGDRTRVNCSTALLSRCLSPTFDYGHGRIESRPGFLRFQTGESTRPLSSDTCWVLEKMDRSCACLMDPVRVGSAKRVLRPDLYDRAMALSC